MPPREHLAPHRSAGARRMSLTLTDYLQMCTTLAHDVTARGLLPEPNAVQLLSEAERGGLRACANAYAKRAFLITPHGRARAPWERLQSQLERGADPAKLVPPALDAATRTAVRASHSSAPASVGTDSAAAACAHECAAMLVAMRAVDPDAAARWARARPSDPDDVCAWLVSCAELGLCLADDSSDLLEQFALLESARVYAKQHAP
ncbi:MAG: hypothetical protein IT355_20645 [Gemmatimonadaceae bacterium]|nr:hypothetical protein [Gemmatimonadaceae bacterium]